MHAVKTIAIATLVLSVGLSAGQRAAQDTKPQGGAGARFARLEAVLAEHVDQNRIAGIVTVVLKDGRKIFDR
jgi:hypothetical protein